MPAFRSLKKGRALGAWTQTTEEEALSSVGADASQTERREPLEAWHRSSKKREMILDSLPPGWVGAGQCSDAGSENVGGKKWKLESPIETPILWPPNKKS